MADNLKFVQAQAFTLAGAGALIGETTVDMSSFLGIDGVPLTMADFGTIGFGTLEPNSGTQEEQICFTGLTQNLNGTATLTGISSVLFISPYTQTPGFSKTHTGGVKFVISNTSGFYNTFPNLEDDETITGTWTFTEPNYPQMNDVNVFPTLPVQLVPKAYADSLTFNGAPNASPTVQGLVQEATTSQVNAGTNIGSTGAVLFASPADMAASIYGLQLPTSGQKSALAGNNTDVAVGSGNEFVTQTGLIHGAEKSATTTGSSNAYVATLSPVITSLTAGMTLTLIANFTNTGATTLAVNGLGSTPAITKYGSTALTAGDIVSGQVFTVSWDGTRWELQNPSSNQVFSFASALTSVTSSTSQVINSAFATTFLPSVITLYYNINGTNSTTQVFSKGVAVFAGTTIKLNHIDYVSQASGTTLTPALTSDANSAPVAGTTDSLTLTIASLSATGFTVVSTFVNSTGDTRSGTFTAVATQ